MNWKCPKCDSYNDAALEFCETCGEPRPSAEELRAAEEALRAREEAARREAEEAERREREAAEAERRAREEAERREAAERREREEARRRAERSERAEAARGRSRSDGAAPPMPTPTPTPAPTPTPTPTPTSSSSSGSSSRHTDTEAERRERAAADAERRAREAAAHREREEARRRHMEELERAGRRRFIRRIILLAALLIAGILGIRAFLHRDADGNAGQARVEENTENRDENATDDDDDGDDGETAADGENTGDKKSSGFASAVEKRRSKGTDDSSQEAFGSSASAAKEEKSGSSFYDTVTERQTESKKAQPADLFLGLGPKEGEEATAPYDPAQDIDYIYGRFFAADEELTKDSAPVLEFRRDGTFTMNLNFTEGFNAYEGSFTTSEKENEMDSVYLYLTVKDPSNGIPEKATVVFDDSPDYCEFLDEGFGLMGYTGAPYTFWSEEFYDLNEPYRRGQ